MVNLYEQRKHDRTREWHAVLAKYAVLSNYRLALDIGTGGGLSALTIAQNGGGTVISVDNESQAGAIKLVHSHGIDVTFRRERSQGYLRKTDAEFDFVSVDGSHDTNDVLVDISASWESLSEGGYMVCDDYEGLKGKVKKAIDTFAGGEGLDCTVELGKAIFKK